MKTLLLVDIQNDFLAGGALAIQGAKEMIPLIADLVNQKFDLIVASKDWHPTDHQSFAAIHNKKIGEVIQLKNLNQILWPIHCVQQTAGAEFAAGWDISKIEAIFYKGTDKTLDSYSTFFDNGHHKSTGLEEFLRSKGVRHLYIAGLATDYCVKYSVLDALNLGFQVEVIFDACRAVNLKAEDEALAYAEMQEAGAKLVNFSQNQLIF